MAANLATASRVIAHEQPAAITLNIRLTVDQRDRSYRLYQPATCRPGFAWPLVLAFHGFLQPNRLFARYTDLETAADQHGFILAMPQGDGWGIFRSFNAGMRDDPNDPDDVHFTAALLADLQQRTTIDRSRIYAIGMSNGGMFAQTLAQQLPGVLAGVVSVSGAAVAPIAPQTPPTPVMLVHGTADPVVPFDGGVMNGRGGTSDILSAPALAERWRELDGCPGPLVADPAGSGEVQQLTAAGCAGNTEVTLVQINGGGHTWPAGRFALPADVVGPTSFAIDASAATAQFFASRT